MLSWEGSNGGHLIQRASCILDFDSNKINTGASLQRRYLYVQLRLKAVSRQSDIPGLPDSGALSFSSAGHTTLPNWNCSVNLFGTQLVTLLDVAHYPKIGNGIYPPVSFLGFNVAELLQDELMQMQGRLVAAVPQPRTGVDPSYPSSISGVPDFGGDSRWAALQEPPWVRLTFRFDLRVPENYNPADDDGWHGKSAMYVSIDDDTGKQSLSMSSVYDQRFLRFVTPVSNTGSPSSPDAGGSVVPRPGRSSLLQIRFNGDPSSDWLLDYAYFGPVNPLFYDPDHDGVPQKLTGSPLRDVDIPVPDEQAWLVPKLFQSSPVDSHDMSETNGAHDLHQIYGTGPNRTSKYVNLGQYDTRLHSPFQGQYWDLQFLPWASVWCSSDKRDGMGIAIAPFLCAADEHVDRDGDGFADAWELYYTPATLSTLSPSANCDYDYLTDYQEYQRGTNPVVFDDPPGPGGDEDGDGLTNWWEMDHGTDMYVWNPDDIDFDGIVNLLDLNPLSFDWSLGSFLTGFQQPPPLTEAAGGHGFHTEASSVSPGGVDVCWRAWPGIGYILETSEDGAHWKQCLHPVEAIPAVGPGALPFDRIRVNVAAGRRAAVVGEPVPAYEPTPQNLRKPMENWEVVRVAYGEGPEFTQQDLIVCFRTQTNSDRIACLISARDLYPPTAADDGQGNTILTPRPWEAASRRLFLDGVSVRYKVDVRGTHYATSQPLAQLPRLQHLNAALRTRISDFLETFRESAAETQSLPQQQEIAYGLPVALSGVPAVRHYRLRQIFYNSDATGQWDYQTYASNYTVDTAGSWTSAAGDLNAANHRLDSATLAVQSLPPEAFPAPAENPRVWNPSLPYDEPDDPSAPDEDADNDGADDIVDAVPYDPNITFEPAEEPVYIPLRLHSKPGVPKAINSLGDVLIQPYADKDYFRGVSTPDRPLESDRPLLIWCGKELIEVRAPSIALLNEGPSKFSTREGTCFTDQVPATGVEAKLPRVYKGVGLDDKRRVLGEVRIVSPPPRNEVDSLTTSAAKSLAFTRDSDGTCRWLIPNDLNGVATYDRTYHVGAMGFMGDYSQTGYRSTSAVMNFVTETSYTAGEPGIRASYNTVSRLGIADLEPGPWSHLIRRGEPSFTERNGVVPPGTASQLDARGYITALTRQGNFIAMHNSLPPFYAREGYQNEEARRRNFISGTEGSDVSIVINYWERFHVPRAEATVHLNGGGASSKTVTLANLGVNRPVTLNDMVPAENLRAIFGGKKCGPYEQGAFAVSAGGSNYWLPESDTATVSRTLYAAPGRRFETESIKGDTASPVFSSVYVNDAGVVVGSSSLWRNGRGYPLAQLYGSTKEPSVWEKFEATGINQHGMIIGTAEQPTEPSIRMPLALLPVSLSGPEEAQGCTLGAAIQKNEEYRRTVNYRYIAFPPQLEIGEVEVLVRVVHLSGEAEGLEQDNLASSFKVPLPAKGGTPRHDGMIKVKVPVVYNMRTDVYVRGGALNLNETRIGHVTGVAGEPVTLLGRVLDQETAPADNRGKVKIELRFLDEFLNDVKDGTVVDLHLEGLESGRTLQGDYYTDSDPRSTHFITKDGKVLLDLPVGYGTTATIRTSLPGEAHQFVVSLPDIALQIAPEAPSVAPDQGGSDLKVTLTSSVKLAPGTPVIWTIGNPAMHNSSNVMESQIDASGSSSVRLPVAGMHFGKCVVTAHAAGRNAICEFLVQRPGPLLYSAAMSFDVLAGDCATVAGSPFTGQADIVPCQGYTPQPHPWRQTAWQISSGGTLSFHGLPGAQYRVKLYNPADIQYLGLADTAQWNTTALNARWNSLSGLPEVQVVAGSDGKAVVAYMSRGGLGGSLTGKHVPLEIIHTWNSIESRETRLVKLGKVHWLNNAVDFTASAFGSDPEGGWGIAGGVVGGFLIVGDAGALMKNSARSLGMGEKKADKLEMALSALGLATTASVADPAVSALKGILIRVRSVMNNANVPRGGVRVPTSVPAMFSRIVDEAVEWLKKGGEGPMPNSDLILAMASRMDEVEVIMKQCLRGADDTPYFAQIVEHVGAGAIHAMANAVKNGTYTAEAITSAIRTIGSMDTGLLAAIKSGAHFDEVFDGLVRTIHHGKLPESDLLRFCQNKALFVPNSSASDMAVRFKDICRDLGDVATHITNKGSFTHWFKFIKNRSNGAINGLLYELELAAHFVSPAARASGTELLGMRLTVWSTRTPGKMATDLDLLVQESGNITMYEAKASASALSSESLARAPGKALDIASELTSKYGVSAGNIKIVYAAPSSTARYGEHVSRFPAKYTTTDPNRNILRKILDTLRDKGFTGAVVQTKNLP